MIHPTHNSKHSFSLRFRLMSLSVAVLFVVNTVIFPSVSVAQALPISLPANFVGGVPLPQPGLMLAPSISFQPAVMAGVSINTENSFEFNFIINTGEDKLQGSELEQESKKLINYFLAALTVPEDQMWVNLSPYEKDRIIADGLSQTEMGRDMLAQDYLLKQLTASMMYPEGEVGRKFWEKIYAKAKEAGSIDIPTDTFNKVWIMPDVANVYVHEKNVFVVKSHLKVMLEDDYLALEKSKGITDNGLSRDVTKNNFKPMNGQAAELLKEYLLPEIEKEVNEGKNFANLRQLYNSMILAAWYKKNLKQSILNKVYANQNKIEGIDVADKDTKEKIYNQYLAAFKKGVYDYIKEDYDPAKQEVVSRKYFSGGLTRVDQAIVTDVQPTGIEFSEMASGNFAEVKANVAPSRRSNDAKTKDVSTTIDRAIIVDQKIKPGLMPWEFEVIGNVAGLERVGLRDLLLKAIPAAAETLLKGRIRIFYQGRLVGDASLDKMDEKINKLAEAMALKVRRFALEKSSEEFIGSHSFTVNVHQGNVNIISFSPDSAIVAEELKFQELPDVPNTFTEVLKAYNLTIKKVEAIQLKGRSSNNIFLPNTEFVAATSISQALGSIGFAGRGKGVKEVADGNAVFLTEKNIQSYISRFPKRAIVVLADEGARDASFSLRMARIYWSGYAEGHKDVYDPDLDQFDREKYRAELEDLRRQGIEISYFAGDALEHTNGLYREGADKESSDSWALASLRDDSSTSQRRPYHDTYFRKAGISFSNPNGDAGVNPFDLPSVVVQKIAVSRGFQQGTPEFEKFVNNLDIIALGPRSAKDKKENEGHKHADIIADAKSLQEKYPGLQVLTPGDGDFASRAISALGISFDGRERITFGRSGMAESTIAEQVAGMVEDGNFVNRFVSKSGTENALNEENANLYTEKEDQKFAELGFTPEEQRAVRRQKDFKGKGTFAMSAVTGASEWLFGKSLSSLLPRVTFNNEDGTVVVSTIVVNQEGTAVLLRTTLKSKDLNDSRLKLLTASPMGAEYVAQNPMPDLAVLGESLEDVRSMARRWQRVVKEVIELNPANRSGVESISQDARAAYFEAQANPDDKEILRRAYAELDKARQAVLRIGDGSALGNNRAKVPVRSIPKSVDPDQAALATNGGIDFNAEHLNLQDNGEKINFDFTNQEFNNLTPESIRGFQPVIINISPLTTIVPLLGFNEPANSHSYQSAKL